MGYKAGPGVRRPTERVGSSRSNTPPRGVVRVVSGSARVVKGGYGSYGTPRSSKSQPVGSKSMTAGRTVSARKLAEIERRRALRRKKIRRNRAIAASILVAFIFSVFYIAAAVVGSSGAIKYHKVLADATDARLMVRNLLLPKGPPDHFLWPKNGEGAVYVMGEGLVAASANQKTVPIASLTKMMTAYIILKDHPLSPGENGPSVMINQADVAEYIYDDQNDLSNVKVINGEVLTERQLLEALLIPSGDNIADILAKWDAGSVAAFVAKMNTEVQTLGLPGTHYVDANGVNHGSSSTATDQVKLASILMANQTVRSIVRNVSMPFPVVGTITNYNPALGQDGIIGVKSGFTGHAGGCLVTAAYVKVGQQNVLVVTGVTGQPNGLYQAATADEQLLSQTKTVLFPYTVPEKARLVGYVTPKWASGRVLLQTGRHAVKVVGWSGMHINLSLTVPNSTLPGRHKFSTVGYLNLTVAGNVFKTIPVVNLSQVAQLPVDYKLVASKAK